MYLIVIPHGLPWVRIYIKIFQLLIIIRNLCLFLHSWLPYHHKETMKP